MANRMETRGKVKTMAGAMSKAGKALEHMGERAGSGRKKPHARHTGKKDCKCPDCR